MGRLLYNECPIDYYLYMKTITKRLGLNAILVSLFPLTAFSTPCDQAAKLDSSSMEKDPSQYIEFISQPDGRCQNLSSGGKLQVVKNNHNDKKIKYRFNRMFAGKRQAGLTIGVLEPGAEPVKLGCTEVDGRKQSWEIQIVNFVE